MQVTKISDSLAWKATEFNYSAARFLQSINVNGIEQASYAYDALGRRIKVLEGSVETITLYAGNDIIYEVKKEDNSETKTRYLVLAGKYLAKMVGDEPNLRTYYYHIDHLGSIRAVSDSTGSIVGLYTYDPFGNVIQEVSYPDSDRIRFTGKRLDSTGLYYFNARYYDPTIGRFISADPARQGLNWYVYCSNNPLVYVDPDGREYVIFWSYGKNELRAFTNQNTIDWPRFDSKNNFSRAAQTRKNELLSNGVSPDNIILKRIDSAEELAQEWATLQMLDTIEGLDFFSHGYSGGPEVAGGGTRDIWDQAGLLKWSSDARAVFYGCNTDKFAEEFANTQKVVSYGQQGYSSFSTNKHIHIPVTNKSKNVYLLHFERANLININGLGVRYE